MSKTLWAAAALAAAFWVVAASQSTQAPIHFVYRPIDFRLESCETARRHAPETMAGGLAVFDYNNDGYLDVFFTNGADIRTLKKTSPKYSTRMSPKRPGWPARAMTTALPLAITITTGSKTSSWVASTGIICTITTATAPSPMSPRKRASPSRTASTDPFSGRGVVGREQRRAAGPLCGQLSGLGYQHRRVRFFERRPRPLRLGSSEVRRPGGDTVAIGYRSGVEERIGRQVGQGQGTRTMTLLRSKRQGDLVDCKC